MPLGMSDVRFPVFERVSETIVGFVREQPVDGPGLRHIRDVDHPETGQIHLVAGDQRRGLVVGFRGSGAGGFPRRRHGRRFRRRPEYRQKLVDQRLFVFDGRRRFVARAIVGPAIRQRTAGTGKDRRRTRHRCGRWTRVMDVSHRPCVRLAVRRGVILVATRSPLFGRIAHVTPVQIRTNGTILLY